MSSERTELRVSVRDNGQKIGASASLARHAGHFGLVGIRERAERSGGELSIKSTEEGYALRVLCAQTRLLTRR